MEETFIKYTMSNKEFVWDDKSVLEFLRFTQGKDRDFTGYYSDLDAFKQSKQSDSKDWEIVLWEYNDYLYANPKVIAGLPHAKIYSVKRLSDGELFELHKTRVADSITKHEWVISDIRVGEDGRLFFNGVNITNVKKVDKPKPLLKFIDGTDIFVGDEFWVIAADSALSITAGEQDRGMWKDAKLFKTKEDAYDWLLLNKPLFNIEDIYNWVYAQSPELPFTVLNFDTLKQLAKEKLSGKK